MKYLFIFLLIFILGAPSVCLADGNLTINTGDTTFVLVSAILVFIMTPALAMFYGGMVRKKNVLNTIINIFFIIAVVSIQWILIGYTLSFGPDKGNIIGGLDWLGFNGVGGQINTDYAPTIPHGAFAMFQLMFAIITAALITGAFAERMNFAAFAIFILLWTTLVYDPLAHWVWGLGGWLRNMGALDFAGGTVVHISSGVTGLIAAILIGKRKGYGSTPMLPHNLPLVAIGAGLLWFGWFGFNAGSALSANELAITAFITTNTAAAAGMLSWIITEWVRHGKPTVLGASSGAIVGLVAITPAAGFVSPLSAIIIGLVAGPLCYFAISVIKPKLKYDDSLDAFGCHGVGGIWGAIATGLFASKSVNPAGANGLFFGNPSLLVTQLIAVISTIALSAIVTFIILKVIGIFINLRVKEEQEEDGLDIAQHGEDAYRDLYPQEIIS